MKRYCKSCDHRCHCVGQGYYVNVDRCDVCICERCECAPVELNTSTKKSWWQIIKGWLF